MSKPEDTAEEIEKLKLGITKQSLKIAYMLLAFVSTNLLPLLLMGAITFTGVLLPGTVNVSHNPLGVTVGGQGTPITQIINVLVVIEVIRNTITLYGKDVPKIITDPSVLEADTDD